MPAYFIIESSFVHILNQKSEFYTCLKYFSEKQRRHFTRSNSEKDSFIEIFSIIVMKKGKRKKESLKTS